ncbi:MAG: hypothetical protein JNM88_00605 [Chitinophagaceae bacterium]|nr:hypothetical protein [Chitinophagaceae bacterium]
MKTIKLIPLLILTLLLSGLANAQNQSGTDSTGLPGDNFSLQGALSLFKEAASIEAFETALNTESNKVNNLDLDGDGNTDYIKVISKADKDNHVFILQAPVSETESQDIAVIELEKTGTETAMIQIIGDEDIYGEEVIVEPDSGEPGAWIEEPVNSNLSGPNSTIGAVQYDLPIVVNVWLWPSVRFVYAPGYRPWVSPWRWRHYPGWWRPWRPLSWHVWHPFRAPWHRSFVVVRTHRVVHAHVVYKPFRSSSVVVRNRHSVAVNNYRVTRSRTTVTGPRGKTTTVKKTTVTGPRGNKATKVKVRRH